MTARDQIMRNKTKLQDILCSDPTRIRDKVGESKLINLREFNNLIILPDKVEEGIIKLVDKIMNKGEDTCKRFLELLRTDADIKDTFPELEKIQWDNNNSCSLDNATQASHGTNMAAKDMITKNKTNLQQILMPNIAFVSQCVFEKKLLVPFEYYNLKSISQPFEAATELVDKMLFKGETTCRAFLLLLQEQEAMLPDLKTMPCLQLTQPLT